MPKFNFADIRIQGLKRSSKDKYMSKKQQKTSPITTPPVDTVVVASKKKAITTTTNKVVSIETHENVSMDVQSVSSVSDSRETSVRDEAKVPVESETNNLDLNLSSAEMVTEKAEDSVVIDNWSHVPHETDTKIAFVGIKLDYEGLVLKGKFGLRSLKGECLINGRVVKSTDEEFVTVLSPNTHRGFPILPIQKCEQKEIEQESPYFKYVEMLEQYNTVVLVKGISPQDEFIKYPGYLEIYNGNAKKDVPICDGVWKSSSNWHYRRDYGHEDALKEIVDKIQKDDVILTCGGKDVGKSSFNRLAINNVLSDGKFPFVYYLECDVGQTEFTPSGFISLVRIQKSQSLLSPPFEHLRTPIFQSFFGAFSPGDEPQKYYRTMEYVWNFFKTKIPADEMAPVFVNTMGWIRGLGLNLLADTLRLVKPTNVVQFDANNIRNRNLELKLTDENLYWMTGWHTLREDKFVKYNHLLVTVQINTHTKSRITYTGADMRNLALFSYFSKEHLKKAEDSIATDESIAPRGEFLKSLLSNTPTYVIKLDDVHVFNAGQEAIRKKYLFAVLNATIVGLSSTSPSNKKNDVKFSKDGDFIERPPICRSYGLGIVRGVDEESRLLYVISPLSREEITKVDCLIFGNYTLPDSLLLDQATKCRGGGDVPYVSQHFSQHVIGAESLRAQRQFQSLK